MITNPLELLRNISNLLGVVHYHASFFSTNTNNFNSKPNIILFLAKFLLDGPKQITKA